MTPSGFVTTHDVALMRALAAQDVPHAVIGARVGCSASTVCRHARGLSSRRSIDPDLDRGRRLIQAFERTKPGRRHHLVEAFGYASLASMNVMACRYRKRLRTPAPPAPSDLTPPPVATRGGTR